SHAYADNGSYTVTLTVTDTHGAASAPATTTATIANVAPAVTAGPNQSATIGTPVTVSATFSDPGANDAPWAYTVAWGDGMPATTAAIANVAPAVNPGPNQTATTGSPVTLSAGFSDPGANDAPWAYSIDWGDGTPATTGSTTSQASPITASHTYTATGASTVRV